MARQEYVPLTKTESRFQLINSELMSAIDRINSSLYIGAITYLVRNGFCWVEVPTLTKITGSCENVDTLFSLDYFGSEAYLSQTGQLYLEAKIPSHKKVWTVIQSSRAEEKVDSRHLCQFTLIEFEHVGNLNMLLENIQWTVQSMVREVLSKRAQELTFWELKRKSSALM